MTIKSFYSRRYFEKRNSKLTIQIGLLFWVVLASVVVLEFHIWFLKIFWLIVSVYQLIGQSTIYREGLYFKPGEKRLSTKNLTPEELIKEAKEEVRRGKK